MDKDEGRVNSEERRNDMGFTGGAEMQDEFKNDILSSKNNGRTVGRSVNPPASRGARNTLEDFK